MSEASFLAGASKPRLAEAWARCHNVVEQSLARGEASGFAIAVRRRGQSLGHLSLGHARAFYAPEGVPGPLAPLAAPEPLTREHAFDWASITKAMCGQLLCMQEVAAGRMQLHTPLSRWLPAFRTSAHANITVSHALTYTSGMPAWRALYALRQRDESLDSLLVRQGLEAEPGERRLYSDLGHIAVGLLLQEQLGMGLEKAFMDRVAAPMELGQTGFLPAQTLRAPSVATSHGNIYERRMLQEPDFGMPAQTKGLSGGPLQYDGFRSGALIGEVDDGNAHYALGGVSAHAGLFGPATDLATLAEAMVWGGADERLGVTPQVRASFVTTDAHNRLPTWWHGAELDTALVRALPSSPAPAVMLRGFSGTCVYVEPATGLTLAMLANREHSNGFGQYVNLRPTFRDVVHLFRHV